MEEASNLIIPKKIKAGYQKRDGTYTGFLGYVIYQDTKGVWRKEKSWEEWRDTTIPVQEFDNTPQDGICLNKDVQRYNWSHFGSNRSYIRIYDPRGIEFEITPENLLGILTETDCLKRGLDGQFVYAWDGKNLVLLPCNSEAYKKAVENTNRQVMKVSAKDLKPGYAYITKKGETVIYLGKQQWSEWSKDYWKDKKRIVLKAHVFAHPTKPKFESQFFRKMDASFLASVESSYEVLEYADLLEGFNQTTHSANLSHFESSTKDSQFLPKLEKELSNPDSTVWFGFTHEIKYMEGDEIIFVFIHAHAEKQKVVSEGIQSAGYSFGIRYKFNTKTMETDYGSYNSTPITFEKAKELASKDSKITAVLTNGHKKSVEDYTHLFD